MQGSVRRVYVEKKSQFNVAAQGLKKDIKEFLNIISVSDVRVLNRYDVSGLDEEKFYNTVQAILSEESVDQVYYEEPSLKSSETAFAVEYLPGQYDQRADSAVQCINILETEENVKVAYAKYIVLSGEVSEEELNSIKAYCINPVDSREGSLVKLETLDVDYEKPTTVPVLEEFVSMPESMLQEYVDKYGLAMTVEDLRFCRDYFRDTEKRNPTLTEIKVLDTYWSDHCRHTTFQTVLKNIEIEESELSLPIIKTYQKYLDSRKVLYVNKKKEICLMDLAVIGLKELKSKGLIDDLDESEEINACSIKIELEIEGKNEDWLLMFKNETHNHPTEIEPFGGAATCLGGCIRDPLSGRTYVYQAMRVTGSGDPTKALKDTIKGKLPQRKITIEAANGYSSYGNQIGLATGLVDEVYDEGYLAKRMEIGAVVAAAPSSNVRREEPKDGDVVILLGGRTGRDGCGGATGSSKAHDESSILKCGSEVQKGNAPTERKLQRLFRNEEASTLIKRCNDFGAGGVSVAIGELSDGLIIELDKVLKKYEGLDGTELSISESQERMAVVVAKEDAEKFIELSNQENLEAVEVAAVTTEKRLRMKWKGNFIVDISREFLNTNGARQETEVKVTAPKKNESYFEPKTRGSFADEYKETLSSLSCCSREGLSRRFDSTIGAGSILMPFGGKYQKTPAEGMVAKIPVLKSDTDVVSIMTYAVNTKVASWSPFHGSVFAVAESLAKVAACGGDTKKARLTFQEYFERLGKDSVKWGKPLSALLGAYLAQTEFKVPALGGKDSMSGSYKDLSVPPTFVSFAVAVDKAKNIVSSEFKKAGSNVYLIKALRDEYDLPVFETLNKNFALVKKLADAGSILSAKTVGEGGAAEAVFKMSIGNGIGFAFDESLSVQELFAPDLCSIIIETEENLDLLKLGETTEDEKIVYKKDALDIAELLERYENTLEKVFPIKQETKNENCNFGFYNPESKISPKVKVTKPRVFIPVFPGTNCEYDSMKAFKRAGADADIMVFNNLSRQEIESSLEEMVKRIASANMIMIPGGFSAGDEPDGSGKFIATAFRNKRVSEAVMKMLYERDGLMLGICNGFQALIKLGLVPFGDIRKIEKDSPTLTYNNVGKHVSMLSRTKVVSKLSPWLYEAELDKVYIIPVSHGEGRFVGDREMVKKLFENGQVAAQYVDLEGEATMEYPYNPNGSLFAVEAITSPDGRILGKMGHSERFSKGTYKNVPGDFDEKIFESGVKYFK